jgi:hypothetical protein
MSMTALLGAVKARLQAALALGEGHVGVQVGGQPPPFNGDLYIALDGSGFDNRDQIGQSLDESYGLELTLTIRCAHIPTDRTAAAVLLKIATGLWDRVAVIRKAIHMNYTVLDLAGGSYGSSTWTGGEPYSLASTINGFVEPLRFGRVQKPQWKFSDWLWSAEPQSKQVGPRVPQAVAVMMTFGGARRCQTIESMT